MKGKFSFTDLEVTLLRRLQLFLEGQWASLWNGLKAEETLRSGIIETRAGKKARASPDTFYERTLRRTRNLVGDGAAAKAVLSLSSEGVHQPSDPAVLDKLGNCTQQGILWISPTSRHTLPPSCTTMMFHGRNWYVTQSANFLARLQVGLRDYAPVTRRHVSESRVGVWLSFRR